MVAAQLLWWVLGVFAVAFVVSKILLRIFDGEPAPPIEISGPPREKPPQSRPPGVSSTGERTCPECGRVIQPTDEVHFDGAAYRHSWCSFNRGAA